MPPNLPKELSFTVRYGDRINALPTEILISKPHSPGANFTVPPEVIKAAQKYIGIWDTGATNSVISQKVVDECGLIPTGMAMVHSATESKRCETFLVGIFLPNKVVFPSIRVTKGQPKDCDVLIGMDIINQGDFAITHKDGKTMFSFRYPSMEKIGFVKKQSEPYHSTKISRNSPCPCGSGKKYKKCCGKNIKNIT
jgi:hypothetical protein